MIVKDSLGTGGPALARYLESGKNEHAELLELRNLAAPTLKAAIYEMDALARCGSVSQHALHVQMRAAPGEHLSASHWSEAIDRVAAELHMQDHQAAAVLHHQSDGCTHCHVVFNVVHPETFNGANLWRSHEREKALARQMEIDWGLRRVSSRKRDRPRDYSRAGRPETEQARRAGADVHELRERLRGAWERSDNGQSFAAALGAEGFTLAQGERRDFVAVDGHGHVYSIGKRATGATAREVREKLADLDPENVPTLAELRQELEIEQEFAQLQALEDEASQSKERKDGRGSEGREGGEEGRGEASAAPAPHFRTRRETEAEAIRARIRVAWDEAKSGQDFPYTLAQAGFTLARREQGGEREGFVAVDERGRAHGIGSRATGATPRAVREKLAGIDPEIIPTLEEVKEAQQTAKPSLWHEFAANANQQPRPGPSPTETPTRPRASPRYYASEALRLRAWEDAADARLERMRQRHLREYDRQQREFDERERLERGEATKGFNDQQRNDLTHALKAQQAAEVARELQRQQEWRAKRDQWAAKQAWADYHAENRAAIEQQRQEREQRRQGWQAGGFRTRTVAEWTRQRREAAAAHTGAGNDNRADRADRAETVAESAARKRREAAQQWQPRDDRPRAPDTSLTPGLTPEREGSPAFNRPAGETAEPALPASVVLARQREAEREQAEKLRRAKELYKQWTDDGHTHDRGREMKR